MPTLHRKLSKRIVGSLIPWIWPANCAACKAILPGRQQHGLCPDCWSEIRPPSAACCPGCGARRPPGLASRCGRCTLTPPPWRRFSHAVTYQAAARRLLLIAKEGGRPEVLGDLADMLHSRLIHLPKTPQWSVVCAVPSRPVSRLRRGYGPSELLARELARALGIPCRTLLRRSWKDPARTRAASKRNRAEAAASAFFRNGAPAAAPLLLVDDVCTTGASLSACTNLLREPGNVTVDVAVWARTPERQYNDELPLEESSS